MSEAVDHPRHYNAHPSGVECIEIVRYMSFNLGNAFKYTWRAGDKGDAVEDLEKALWYVRDERSAGRETFTPAIHRGGREALRRAIHAETSRKKSIALGSLWRADNEASCSIRRSSSLTFACQAIEAMIAERKDR